MTSKRRRPSPRRPRSWVFRLNFSRPGEQIVAQYYFLQLGREAAARSTWPAPEVLGKHGPTVSLSPRKPPPLWGTVPLRLACHPPSSPRTAARSTASPREVTPSLR